MDAMYVDKLDEKVSDDFFDRVGKQYRKEQTRILREIERHQKAEQSYMEEGVRLLELATALNLCSNASLRQRSVAC